MSLEQAPFYLPNFTAQYYSACCPPSPPAYWAHFNPVEGLDCIKNIPLECTNSVRPVAAAARYRITVGGSPSSSPNAYSGALFLLSAVYDETAFDVIVHGSALERYGTQAVYRSDRLGCLETLLFQDTVYLLNWDYPFRQSLWRFIPDYVEIRLKDGVMLEDLHGRTVRLRLHTLNWAGNNEYCNQGTPYRGDALSFAATDEVEIGACSDAVVEDWWIEPPPLHDECAAPQLPEARQQSAEFEAVGARVVNDVNAGLPALRVGHNRWRAGRSFAETLGNDAVWHAYGPADFVAVNMFGVWFAAEDVPGWTWSFYQQGSETRLRVNDTCANKSYRFLTTDSTQTPGQITWEDYEFRRAKLLAVHQPASSTTSQRTYDYQGGSVASNLIRQKETASPETKIEYGYQTEGNRLVLNLTGTAPDGTRQAQTKFDPGPSVSQRPLVQASMVGGGASRLYEWYPEDSDPATKCDRKLKKVSDAAGRVLLELEYDSQGRLTKRSRGAVAQGTYQLLAEFLYDQPATGEMEARFYTDATHYQVAVRTFSSRKEVTAIREYEQLASGGVLPDGNQATTYFDYHTPPPGTWPGQEDPFYHRVCYFGQAVVLSRCVEKTWPSGLASEYTFFDNDCHFLPVESYLGNPNLTSDPPAGQKRRHVTRQWSNGPGGVWGIWQVTQEFDRSRNGSVDNSYDANGFLTRRDEPLVNVGVYTGFRAFRTQAYDTRHRVDHETRNDGSGATITTSYGYDVYDNLNRRTDNPGAGQIEWLFTYDSFGQEIQRTDPAGYVTRRQWNNAGLLTRTYTFAGGDSGPVLKQTDYVYVDGQLSQIRVADHDGPFTLNAPAAWVVTTYAYDDYGRVITRTIAPGNHVTAYVYDFQDRLTRITYPDGLWKETVRNGRGQITETRLGPDPVLISTYSYDLNGSLVARNCQGCPDCATQTTYQYDAYNRRTAEIRPDGATWFEYDNAGQVTRRYTVAAGSGQTLSDLRTEFDNLGRPWRTLDMANPGGILDTNNDRITETGYDQAGNTKLQRRKATFGNAETLYTYDFANRRLSMTDAEAGVTTYAYDQRGNAVSVKDPVNNETRFVFDGAGRTVEEKHYEIAVLDLRLLRAYDSRDNLIAETARNAAGQALTQKRWEFDELGRNTRRAQMADPTGAGPVNLAVDRVTDLAYIAGSSRVDTETTYVGNPAQSRTTNYDYDNLGRLTRVTDANGDTETRAYTVHSQVGTKTVHEPPLTDRTFTYVYDDLGRLTSETALGATPLVTSYVYDALGRRTRVTDPNALITDTVYTPFGQVAWVTEGVGALPRQTFSGYNQLGHLVTQQAWDGLGGEQTTLYTPDKLGRRKRIDFCDSGAWSYLYDNAGRTTQRTDPNGLVTVYSRNWRGQIWTESVGGQPRRTFVYNALGWILAAQNNAAQVHSTYDGFGQVLVQVQTPTGGPAKTLAQQFNQAGERTRLTYPADTGVELTFEQDGLGRATAIRRNNVELASYAYAGDYVTDRYVWTTAAVPTVLRRNMQYGVHRRLHTLVNSIDVEGTVTEFERYAAQFNKAGNPLRVDVTGSPDATGVTYAYDELQRLIWAAYSDAGNTNESFAYDRLGNRTSTDGRRTSTGTYAHNCVNEYTDITPGPVDPQHDPAGNLTRNEYGFTLAYDYEQRLRSVYDPFGAELLRCRYDAFDRRVCVERADGESVWQYHDPGAGGQDNCLLAEYAFDDPIFPLLRYYVHGAADVDEPVAVCERGSSGLWRDFYYLLGRLNSVTGLVDETGQVRLQYGYDAYGLRHVYGEPCDVLRSARCDCNCDGTATWRDIDYLIAALNDNVAGWTQFYADQHGGALPPCDFWCVNDLDGDGHVTWRDINPFIECMNQVLPPWPPAQPYGFAGREVDLDVRARRDPDGAADLGTLHERETQFDPNALPVLVLHHYRARSYDPWHGRFYQRDPALYADSMNLYEYVRSRPATGRDPTGRFSLAELLQGATYRANYASVAVMNSTIAMRVAQVALLGTIFYNAYLVATDPGHFSRLGEDVALYHTFPGATTAMEQLSAIYRTAKGIRFWAGRPLEAGESIETAVGDPWTLSALKRGIAIENDLARTTYADWFRVGRGGFPLVDFQKGNDLVSLKTIDTRGTRWVSTIMQHIMDLATRGANVNGTPANMILDLRVQPGGAEAAKWLVQFGREQGVVVTITEYP